MLSRELASRGWGEEGRGMVVVRVEGSCSDSEARPSIQQTVIACHVSHKLRNTLPGPRRAVLLLRMYPGVPVMG